MSTLAEDLFYILKDSRNPVHKCFPNDSAILELAEYLQAEGVIIAKKQICPNCGGRGKLLGNFYEVPGVSVSYGGYADLQYRTVQCWTCLGSGYI